ncbi:MAG: sulfite reductase subunit alpha [Opitutus sp.]|nr:sulfite reductase subunit alpha [Opitutus sp.]MCS6245929.1 sulfite reductase subunit alpha [Opitutus sp.]MCS6272933.1 sulfite reductase subunit alpha [Opitutus sp.]MCS6275992.1 sulfite reductase subunit alpha [Opitutus sp.]MCS6301087.1 sulfite reductase subunit alpha [Opitutus sp.]
MSTVPLIPESAPFTSEQRAWLNGFLAGIFSRAPGSQLAAPSSQLLALAPLTILFGSQTGTSESLAKQAAKEAGKRGFAATILDLAAVTVEQLPAHSNLLLITSTYGEGEPPDNAKALHSALLAAAPSAQLASVNFSVCSLGDTNYTLFCQAGKDFDLHLEKLGAKRVSSRVDCDVDYEAAFIGWLDTALGSFSSAAPTASTPSAGVSPPTAAHGDEAETGFSKKNPFPAPVLTVRNLNAPGSAKEVNHVEFDLNGSGLSYEAGDALGVIAQNCPELVTAVITALGCDGEEAVPTPEGDMPLRKALTQHYDLGKPAPALLDALAIPTEARAPLHHVLDALRFAPLSPEKQLTQWVSCFRKLQPRLYSISSSPKAHPGQVHLTVGAVRYEVGGVARKGVCSTFLAERALAHGTAGVFVHSNKAFRPPADPAAPMIMVGPGTGIAPFRAFLEERAATQSPGKNWLFFGDQKAASDFLYREELEALQAAGILNRLDVAFSRDQAEKIYVQTRMVAAATELYAWLEQGAYFYVCGDASRMAKDVDAALHKVVEIAGGKSAEQAAAYIQALKAAKRYQRDVY